MDEEQIRQLVKYIQESKMPEWWLKIADQLAYNLQVHTKGLIFDKITGLYPHEHPESHKHCVTSFEPITKASIWKAINNIVRIFNNSSYNIKISDKTKQIIEEYQKDEGSFFSQFMEDWIKYAVANDPNGYCVWYPLDYTDDLYRYVCYKDIIYVSDDVLIFKSEVESETKTEFIDREYTKEVFIDYEYELAPGIPNVRHGVMKTFASRLETKYINPVYHAFTKTHLVRFFKDNPGDKEFKFETIPFPYELDTLPYFENGGIEIEKDLYESFVQAFVPYGNKALVADRNLRAVDLMFSYPRMQEMQTECDVCNGVGTLKCDTSVNPSGFITCKRCKGSKFITIQSPYKVYLKRPNNSFDVDGKMMSEDSVKFFTPDTGILDYSSQQPDRYLRKAEEAVFVQQKVETGNVQAAKSKEIDREELYAWLANVAKVLYNNLQMGLQYLENYVNRNPITVSVEKPYSFAILSEAEAFDALSKMLSSSAPVPIKANQIDNFVNKFISESSPVKRALHILKKFDLLLYYSNEDLASLKSQGAVDSKALIRHVYAYPALIQMYERDKNLFMIPEGETEDLMDEQIIKKLEIEISKYDLTRDLRTNILNNIPTNGISEPKLT